MVLSVGAGLCSALFSSSARPRAEQRPAPTHSLPLPFAIHPHLGGIRHPARRAAGASAPTVSALPFVLHHGLGGIRHPRLRAIRESPLRQKHRRRFFVGADASVRPHLRHCTRAGEDSASDGPRGTSGCRSQCPWGRRPPLRTVVVTAYHPTGPGGIRHPGAGDCRRCIFAADYLTTFRAKKPCNSQKLVYNRVVEAEAALMQQTMGL